MKVLLSSSGCRGVTTVWTARCLPHLSLCLLKALGHKVHVLEGGDDALLVAGHRGVEGQDVSVFRERMLRQKQSPPRQVNIHYTLIILLYYYKCVLSRIFMY